MVLHNKNRFAIHRSPAHTAYLGICRPVGHVFQPLPNVGVFQDVERLETNFLISQQANQGSAEPTSRCVGSALDEHDRFRAEETKKKKSNVTMTRSLAINRHRDKDGQADKLVSVCLLESHAYNIEGN